MSTAQVADPELESVAWDLSPLLSGDGDGDPQATADGMLADAQRRSDAFRERYVGKVADLDSAGLAEAMDELSTIHDLAGRVGNYAALWFSTDTSDPKRGALLQRVQELETHIETALIFFDLEWAAVPDEAADTVIDGDGLELYRHHLRQARRYRPHLLSEPEEKIFAEKSLTARSAWNRLFAEATSAIRVELDGDKVALEVALARLHHPDRETRRDAAERVTAALQPDIRTRGFIFNTLLADKMVDDRLRHYPTWLSSRNLANEASDESVEALVQAVRARYELPRRWYRLKARLLGLDRLADYDRMAAVAQEDETFSWSESVELVMDSFRGFSADLGDVAQEFFDRPYIDAPVREGKRGGAFCAYTVPSAHPYLMLNHTGRRRDVLTLAHELGHGVHASLSRPQGVFQQGTPLTLAETASVFGETIVFGRLLDEAPTAESRLSLLAESIEGTIATVFRQIAMNQFEHGVHTERREVGELSVERISEIWATSQSDLLGDAVEVTEGYRSWWSYVPHFINTPGYVYAYAYGQLLAMSVYSRFEEEGESFIPSYLELLSAGGSRSPEELGSIVGVDLADPGFWDRGLDLVERQLEAAEAAAREARGVE